MDTNDYQNNKMKVAVFQDKKIRRLIHQDEWWFSIIDVVAVLTESDRPRKYWSDLKKQLIENEGFISCPKKSDN